MRSERLTQALLLLVFLALMANALRGVWPKPAEAQFSFGMSTPLVEAVQGIAAATDKQARALQQVAQAVRKLKLTVSLQQ